LATVEARSLSARMRVVRKSQTIVGRSERIEDYYYDFFDRGSANVW